MSPTGKVTVRGRIEGLDGVRTVLHWIVVLTHLQLINQAGGWMAMQMFFLLSGFLISRVLLDLKLSHGLRRYFAEFLTFRFLRILPAYYAYLVALFAGAYLWAPDFFAQISKVAAALFLFVFNYAWIWSEPVRTPWLGHLWSLAVEEQFYLLWPWLVWFTPLRRLPAVMLAIILAGPLFRALTYFALEPFAHRIGSGGADAVYVAMPTYLDTFAMGGLLCFDDVRRRLARIPDRVFALAILAALVAGLLWNFWASGGAAPDWATLGYPITMHAKKQFLWGYSVTGALLMVFLAKIVETGFAHRLLCIPILERVGQVTYSLYLIHHGLILLMVLFTSWALAQFHLAASWTALLLYPAYTVVLYAVAFASFEWIEKPAMRLKQRLFPRAAPRAAA